MEIKSKDSYQLIKLIDDERIDDDASSSSITSTDIGTKSFISQPSTSIVVHNPHLVANFKAAGRLEVFTKLCNEACQKGNYENLALKINDFLDLNISTILNNQTWYKRKYSQRESDFFAHMKYFVSATFIVQLIEKGFVVENEKKFFNDLIESLNGKTLSNMYTYPSIKSFTFDDFIRICKAMIDNQSDVTRKKEYIFKIMQILHTTYLKNFNENGYTFIKYLLSREFCNVDTYENIRFRLITQIPKYNDDFLFPSLVTTSESDEYLKNELPILLPFIINGPYKGVEINEPELRNIVKKLMETHLKKDNSCVIYACKYIENNELPEIIKYLINLGADVKKSSMSNDTCLHGIIYRVYIKNDPNITLINEKVKQTIAILISNGADFTHKNNDQKTASDYVTAIAMEHLIK